MQYQVSYNSQTYLVTGTSWQVPVGLLSIGTYPVTVRSLRASWSSVVFEHRDRADDRCRRHRLRELLNRFLLPNAGNVV